QIEWISHARQPEEAALLTQLQESLNVIAGHGRQGQLIATHLMKAASSSQFALEQQLNRMQHLRNQITHGLEEFLNDSDRDTNLWSDDIESNPTPNLYQQTLLKFGDRIAALIETLEAVSTDSKLDSLISLLNRLGLFSSSDRRVCIFTSYIATATFLESTLSEHHSHVASVTGSLSYTEREQAVSNFGQNGGILIATPAMSMWIPEVAAVIFYDLPMNPATLDAGIGEYIRIGRSGPAHICAFTDESEILLIEQLQKTIEIEKALGSDEALKLPFPDDHTKMNGSQECSE
ncbi:helicase-related protein, partial [Mariniblastus sp.]|nr:helicase-related protein [Mariniblastus sp.]